MNNCPNCGFDLLASALLRVRLNKAGIDPSTMPEHLAGLFCDLDNLVKEGYAERLGSGWFIPTNKYRDNQGES